MGVVHYRRATRGQVYPGLPQLRLFHCRDGSPGNGLRVGFVLSLPVAAAVVVWAKPFTALVGGVFAVATISAFLWSSLFGLFGYHETLLGRWQVIAAATEVATALVAAVVLVYRRPLRPGHAKK
jgi:hypothetical protein